MQQKKMRDVGFVVGQTDWRRMTDPTFGDSALTKTKYIWISMDMNEMKSARTCRKNKGEERKIEVYHFI